ncbi:hypothetical protein KVR01_006805 [Diaporthe batatas]|uniref:uncharacterized protein n=1 Tax=Diaporthe batatas TaxID=748121 RepID=UPI001D042F03|nr:uncharacterized protein KVR01_006805 [Diaporthe batatas]KAG8163508.1 hypothetical protein KVR01_006805 [Diaporthe batatas]
MEDPWGSPWATDTNTSLEPTIPRSTLELPSRTLTRQRSFSTASPWAVEDDALNDWASADPGLALPTPAAASSSIWGGWGSENGPNSSQTQLAHPPRAREGSLGMHSPSWPAATSPGLPPARTISRRSSSRSLFRQPSPDPWAVEFPENRLSLPTPALVSAEQAAFSTLDRHDEEDEEEIAKIREEEQAVGAAPDTGTAQNVETTQNQDSTRDEEVDPVTKTDDEVSKGEDVEGTNPRSPSDSRHSSVSAGSHHDDRPDSPITSMDEDAKDRPKALRRPSVKVQEMVDKFDGMTKPKEGGLSVPVAPGGRKRSASRGGASIRSTRTEDISEFGEFEDAETFDSAPPSRKPSVAGSSRPGSRVGPAVSALQPSSRGSGPANLSTPRPIPEERANSFQDLRTRFGPVAFTAELGGIDKLFDIAKLDAEQPSAKDYSLDAVDGIINDSFSSVSERKTWYRISRPGSMRRHNLGDDENYRRVTWPASKMREETNQVVRRWMEEDSFSGGRPSFGNNRPVKGGAFNWDAKAEPLSMDQIFGKRKSAQPPPKPASATVPRPLSLQPKSAATHARNLSAGVKSLPPRSPGVSSLPPPSPMSIPGPPKSPAFGWSTMTNGSVTPASSRPPSIAARQSLDVPSSTLNSTAGITTSAAEPESRSSLQLVAPSVSSNVLVEEDEDEEWGEMVASPSVASPMGSSRPVSGVFDIGVNSSVGELGLNDASSLPSQDTGATLVGVTSKLEQDEADKQAEQQPPQPSAAIWDFSAFETTLTPSFAPVTPTEPAIPPTTTSKPEFDFDSPLQSPALSGPSRTGSPTSAFQMPTPSTPSGQMPSSRTSSSASFQLPALPTPPISGQSKHTPKSSTSSQPALEPVRPISPAAFQLSKPPSPKHSTRPSLSLGRPSPLQHVITPKASSPKPMSPTIQSAAILPPAKSVNFAEPDEESAAVARIVDALPDLSYMFR